MDNIYDAIKNGKTNTEIINEFCQHLNETRARYNEEQAEIRRKQQQEEEDKRRQDKLTSARYYVIDDFADYLELLFPEYTTNRVETEDRIEQTLLEFEETFTSFDKTIKTINEILNKKLSNDSKKNTSTNPNINKDAAAKKENTN